MFAAEGATADSVCIVFPFFVPRSQSEHVDEVHCRRALSVRHHFVLQITGIFMADAVYMILWCRGTCKTSSVLLRLEKREGFSLTLSSRAFSNFTMSLWPLSELPAARNTYLWFPFTFSVQQASQVTVWSCMIFLHFPGTLGTGVGTPSPILSVMSSGRTRN